MKRYLIQTEDYRAHSALQRITDSVMQRMDKNLRGNRLFIEKQIIRDALEELEERIRREQHEAKRQRR